MFYDENFAMVRKLKDIKSRINFTSNLLGGYYDLIEKY